MTDIVTAQGGSAAGSGQVQNVLAADGVIAPAETVEQVADTDLLHHAGGVAAGSAVHTDAEALDTGTQQVGDPTGAGAEVHIGDGAGGDAGVGIRHQLYLLIVKVDAVGVVEAVAQKIVTAEPFGGPAAVVFLHKGDFATAFRQVSMHFDVQLFGQIDGSTDDFFRFIIGDAGADADLTHRETGRIVVLFHQPFGVTHDAFDAVHHLGRDNIAGDGVITAHRMEADTQFLCGFDFGIYQTGHADGVRIPQVIGGGDTGFQSLAQRHIHTGTGYISVQVLIDLVHGGEPWLQPQTLCGLNVADKSLPGVMMCIDKAGQDNAAAGIYYFIDGDGIAKGVLEVFADGLDLFAADEQIRMTVAAALLIHGDDPIGILVQYSFHNVFSFRRDQAAFSSFFSGRMRLRTTAVMAVPGTPLSRLEAQKGRAARASEAALKPTPTAREMATMVVVRAVSGPPLWMTFIPETRMVPKAERATPPKTAEGMQENTAHSLGQRPQRPTTPPAMAVT